MLQRRTVRNSAKSRQFFPAMMLTDLLQLLTELAFIQYDYYLKSDMQQPQRPLKLAKPKWWSLEVILAL